MKLEILALGIYQTNCYLLYDEESKEGAIIDPGDEAERIIDRVDNLGFTPQMILLTHGHIDHIGAVNDVKAHYDIPIFAGKGEEKLLASAADNMSAAFGSPVTCPPPDKILAEGEEVNIGSIKLTVIPTPGHSPGGVCFYSGKILICGDTLFYGSVGRTDFPGCSHEKLISSIIEKLLVLPNDTVCYPGHGPATTIGQEKANNPFLTGSHFV
ncbi:MAG: MBL fold metallo-hydrolase [FCB group bacterium]|nr:MBL fold metallo-hydrolase [FCB group bacterium]